MLFLITDTFNDSIKKQLFELLCEADKEFIPPLSSRNSTVQSELKNVKTSEQPILYFEQVLKQTALLAVDEDSGEIIGMMSLKPDYSVKLENTHYSGVYLSTLIVRRSCRNKGTATALYQKLFETYKGQSVITRTWSTNKEHLSLLDKLNFKLIHTVKNSRGEGIDTVYYKKDI